jgi:hypothetical protein
MNSFAIAGEKMGGTRRNFFQNTLALGAGLFVPFPKGFVSGLYQQTVIGR